MRDLPVSHVQPACNSGPTTSVRTAQQIVLSIKRPTPSDRLRYLRREPKAASLGKAQQVLIRKGETSQRHSGVEWDKIIPAWPSPGRRQSCKPDIDIEPHERDGDDNEQ